MGSWKPASARGSVPPASVRSALSIWLVVHLGLVAVSLSAVVAGSVLQVRLLNAASLYLTPLHLRVDGQPIYLTHGEPEDQTHRVQWLRAGSDEWESDEVRGWRGSERLRRYSRFARAIAGAAEREETATASLLALPLVRQEMEESEQHDLAPPVRMRVVRLALALLTAPDPLEPVETTRWEAGIIAEPAGPDGSPRWSLVTVKERRLNAAAARDEES